MTNVSSFESEFIQRQNRRYEEAKPLIEAFPQIFKVSRVMATGTVSFTVRRHNMPSRTKIDWRSSIHQSTAIVGDYMKRELDGQLPLFEIKMTGYSIVLDEEYSKMMYKDVDMIIDLLANNWQISVI